MTSSRPLVSVIVTVLNEAATISLLLDALLTQTLAPAEIIIVDGGSSDATRDIIQAYQKQFSTRKLRLFLHRGNISQGRNEAVRHSRHAWLAITDAGCEPAPSWLAELVKCQQATQTKAVAGFYFGKPNNRFEAAVVPYALVMPDQLDESTFLPASRSLLISKAAYNELSGFNETLVVSEDYDFAHRFITRFGRSALAVASAAKVAWQPRSSLSSFAKMVAQQAEWDVRASRLRKKVVFLWIRYGVGLLSLCLYVLGIAELAKLLVVAIFIYLWWAIAKNYRYARSSWFWFPILQLVADGAVLAGSARGAIVVLLENTHKITIRRNKG